MTDKMKINKPSTTENLTVGAEENALIVGPFSGASVTVNGSLCVCVRARYYSRVKRARF